MYYIETVAAFNDVFWSMAESCAVCIPSGAIDTWNSHPPFRAMCQPDRLIENSPGCRHAERKNTLTQANFSSLLVRQRQAEWAVKQGQSVETMPPKNCKHSCFFLPHLWAYDGCHR